MENPILVLVRRIIATTPEERKRMIEETKAAVTRCQECGHLREDHSDCGCVCLKCNCSRFRNVWGLAPCASCNSRDHLVKVPVNDGRETYWCARCRPLEVKL